MWLELQIDYYIFYVESLNCFNLLVVLVVLVDEVVVVGA
jgi:hypothetical protein